jgi:DNA-binding MarR family transcriptional regulator
LDSRAGSHYIDINANAHPRAMTISSTSRSSRAAREQALASLRIVVGALSQSARTVERRTGITNAQLFLLQQIQSAGPLSVSELARRARTQQSTVSIVVARLVRARLATNVRTADDARRAAVSLTAGGRALLRRAPTPPTVDVLRAVEGLSPLNAGRLAAGLAALVRALGLLSRPPGLLFEDTRPSTSRSVRARAIGATRALPSRRERS